MLISTAVRTSAVGLLFSLHKLGHFPLNDHEKEDLLKKEVKKIDVEIVIVSLQLVLHFHVNEIFSHMFFKHVFNCIHVTLNLHAIWLHISFKK
jgi:hypothetical protein